jgi:hypothetical protein
MVTLMDKKRIAMCVYVEVEVVQIRSAFAEAKAGRWRPLEVERVREDDMTSLNQETLSSGSICQRTVDQMNTKKIALVKIQMRFSFQMAWKTTITRRR